MKAICNRAKLAESMEYVSEVAQVKSPKPVLQCVRIQADKAEEKLMLSGTDLELGIKCEIKEAQIGEDGQVVVNAGKLSSLFHELSDETVTLQLVEDTFEVDSAGGTFKFYTFPADEFPPITLSEVPLSASVLATNMAEVINQTIYAVAKETTRYAINGLLIEFEDKKLTMVGTDGRRLAWANVGVVSGSNEKVSCIAPPRAMQMLARLASHKGDDVQVGVRIAENQIIFELPEVTILSSLVEGQFPDYSSVIPKDHSCRIVVSRLEFLALLRRILVFTQTKDTSHGARLKPEDGKVIVDVPSSEVGEASEQMQAEISGEPVQIGFDPKYMMEPLRALNQEQVIMELKAPKVPMVLKAGSNFVYVLMPVTI